MNTPVAATSKTALLVVGARPNFMKIKGLHEQLLAQGKGRLLPRIVHTGQHYDVNMSDVFFRDLELPKPDRFLGIGSGGHGEMTGRIMIEFEKVCLEEKPSLVIVVGDVNSTIAAALVARKLDIRVAHVEAGLRSFDERMPEELNRRLTDNLSNYLFVSEPGGMENLRKEGIASDRCHLVGDTMTETLSRFLPRIEEKHRCRQFDLKEKQYGLVTLHRPSNVDTKEGLEEILAILSDLKTPVLFPIHPRTTKRIESFGLAEKFAQLTNIRQIPPEGYLDFLSLAKDAQFLLTDSGSVQAETSYFNTPCLVMRENTERPLYVDRGTTTLVFRDREKIRTTLAAVYQGSYKKSGPEVFEYSRNVSQKIAATLLKSLD